jgi:hypothetical protein
MNKRMGTAWPGMEWQGSARPGEARLTFYQEVFE